MEFVQEHSFLNGWFGERRRLNSIEIGLLFFNMTRNILGASLLTVFSQVAKSQQVRDYMLKGKEIAKNMQRFLVRYSGKTIFLLL